MDTIYHFNKDTHDRDILKELERIYDKKMSHIQEIVLYGNDTKGEQATYILAREEAKE